MSVALEKCSRDPVSQRDIARHFGVSHVTVSLALRNSRRVSKSLSGEIRAYADAVGYRRDPVLAALAAYRDRKSSGPVRGAIGWINAWDTPEDLRAHPEVDRFWHGASAAAAGERFRLEEFRLGSELSVERLHQVLETRNIRGLILPPHRSPEAWRGFPWEEYAVVTLGHSEEGPHGHRVMSAAAANLAVAFRKIRESGYRRIGCLTGPSLLRHAGYGMEEGFHAAQRGVMPGDEVPLLDLAKVPAGKAAAKVRQWIMAHRIEAVLADDATLRKWVEKAGYTVPDEIAFSTMARSNEAGIDPGSEEIGRTALQMLESLMRERANGVVRSHHHLAIEGTWHDGATLPRKQGSPMSCTPVR